MKKGRWIYVLRTLLLLLLALWAFAPGFLASERPLLMLREGRLLRPAVADTSAGTVLLRAPVRFDPQGMDRNYSGYVSPAENLRRGGTHYLGTDELGRDTLAGLVAGVSASLRVGVIASLLALALALLPALTSGYYASERKRAHFLILVCDVLLSLAALWTLYISLLTHARAGILILCAVSLPWLFLRNRFRTWCIRRFPRLVFRYSPDALLLRITDGYELFPKIILLLVIFAFVGWKAGFLALLLGVAGWPFFYRYLRADTMRIKALPFVRAALLQNVPAPALAWRYFLPSLLPLILSLLPFMFIASVLAETTLGFIGLGLDPAEITLGRMIAEGRTFPDAWWLMLFPSLVLSGMMGAFYLLGRRLSRRFSEEK
ncbi:MAG: ABC transporter permease [Flavobacteriales bacterium]